MDIIDINGYIVSNIKYGYISFIVTLYINHIYGYTLYIGYSNVTMYMVI